MKGAIFLTLFLIMLAMECSSDHQNDSQNPIVELNCGKLEGLVKTSSERKRKFTAFLSVPYAKPPIGQRRFKPPEPIEPWTGTFVADREDVICPQFGYRRKNDTEDCLVLNVYSPCIINEADKPLLPVMVIFNEGAYQIGSGAYSFYKPEKLMDHDVVFVSPNHRLGILGFLNTEDIWSPGNYGSLDQVMVLTWVRDNIKKFGGDPTKVTIFGNSAGGVSVVYLMLSPLSEGLFHGAIAQSGSAIIPSTFQPHPLKWARKSGELANCPNVNSSKELVECLRSKTIDELFWARKAEVKYYYLSNVGPSVESQFGSGFLKERPLELMKKGQINKVPFITGVVKDEGRIFLSDILDFKKYSGQRFLDEEFCGFLLYILDVEENKDTQTMCAKVKKEYFDGKNISDPDVLISCLSKAIGDMKLCAGVSETAELFSAAGIPTQAYKITYVIEGTNATGNFSNHGDEITLMLDRKWSSNQVLPSSKNDQAMGRLFNHIWTQFAITGNNTIDIKPPGMPSFEWPLYSSRSESSRKYLDINLHPEVINGLLCDKTEFWTNQLVLIKKI